jgi:aminobenzoyl-glutamate utilization protein B
MEFGTACCMLGTPGHSWQFAAQSGMSIGHKGLIFASKVIAASGLELMTNPELLSRVREEWVERLAGRSYKPPIPMDLKPPLNQLKK